MQKAQRILAVAVATLLTGTATARAQSVMSPEGTYFVNISLGAQPQERSFSTSSTFTSFNETGASETVQNIGSGTLFDITGGYQFTKRLAFGLGVWGARSDSAVSATVAMPDAIFYNRFSTVNLSAEDLSQLTSGFNLQLLWRQPLNDRLDITLSIGPTLLYVRQQVGIVSVTPNTMNAAIEVETQSKFSLKAGNAGAEIGFRFRDNFGIGGFVRYAGGEVDLPSVPKLKAGGTQVGGGLRFRF